MVRSLGCGIDTRRRLTHGLRVGESVRQCRRLNSALRETEYWFVNRTRNHGLNTGRAQATATARPVGAIRRL